MLYKKRLPVTKGIAEKEKVVLLFQMEIFRNVGTVSFGGSYASTSP
jgi:hypothetical protein